MMALDLLVNEFKIPKDRLVITYYGGDSDSTLPSDDETKEIWHFLGLVCSLETPFQSSYISIIQFIQCAI